MRSAVHLCCQLQQCFDPKLLVSVSAGRSSFASSASRARHFFSTEEYMEPPFGGPNRCQENLLAKQLLVYMSWKAWELGGNSLECERWHRNGRIECVVVSAGWKGLVQVVLQSRRQTKTTGEWLFFITKCFLNYLEPQEFLQHPEKIWKEADLRRLLEQVHLESGTGTLATKGGNPPPGQIWGALQGVCWPQSWLWCGQLKKWLAELAGCYKHGWLRLGFGPSSNVAMLIMPRSSRSRRQSVEAASGRVPGDIFVAEHPKSASLSIAENCRVVPPLLLIQRVITRKATFSSYGGKVSASSSHHTEPASLAGLSAYTMDVMQGKLISLK